MTGKHLKLPLNSSRGKNRLPRPWNTEIGFSGWGGGNPVYLDPSLNIDQRIHNHSFLNHQKKLITGEDSRH